MDRSVLNLSLESRTNYVLSHLQTRILSSAEREAGRNAFRGEARTEKLEVSQLFLWGEKKKISANPDTVQSLRRSVFP
jgi:hypothetical protein